MLKVCHTLSFSFRARRSFEPSQGTLRIGIGIPIYRFLCKILQSSKFIAKSKRPQKQPTKFCIGSAKNKSKTKHPRLSVLSFLTAKSGQSDQDEVRSDFEVRVDSFWQVSKKYRLKFWLVAIVFLFFLLKINKLTNAKGLCPVAKKPCSQHKWHFLRSSYENRNPNFCWMFCAILGVLCN